MLTGGLIGVEHIHCSWCRDIVTARVLYALCPDLRFPLPLYYAGLLVTHYWSFSRENRAKRSGRLRQESWLIKTTSCMRDIGNDGRVIRPASRELHLGVIGRRYHRAFTALQFPARDSIWNGWCLNSRREDIDVEHHRAIRHRRPVIPRVARVTALTCRWSGRVRVTCWSASRITISPTKVHNIHQKRGTVRPAVTMPIMPTVCHRGKRQQFLTENLARTAFLLLASKQHDFVDCSWFQNDIACAMLFCS